MNEGGVKSACIFQGSRYRKRAENCGVIGSVFGSFVEFFMWSLSFRIEKWLFAVHGGSSRGETRLKWPISQSARGK